MSDTLPASEEPKKKKVRINLDISEEFAVDLERLRKNIGASTSTEAIRRSVKLMILLTEKPEKVIQAGVVLIA